MSLYSYTRVGVQLILYSGVERPKDLSVCVSRLGIHYGFNENVKHPFCIGHMPINFQPVKRFIAILVCEHFVSRSTQSLLHSIVKKHPSIPSGPMFNFIRVVLPNHHHRSHLYLDHPTLILRVYLPSII